MKKDFDLEVYNKLQELLPVRPEQRLESIEELRSSAEFIALIDLVKFYHNQAVDACAESADIGIFKDVNGNCKDFVNPATILKNKME